MMLLILKSIGIGMLVTCGFIAAVIVPVTFVMASERVFGSRFGAPLGIIVLSVTFFSWAAWSYMTQKPATSRPEESRVESRTGTEPAFREVNP